MTGESKTSCGYIWEMSKLIKLYENLTSVMLI